MKQRANNQLAAIVLAAGSSSRFGESNKLHERLPGGNSVIEQVIQIVSEFPFDHRLVVCSPNDVILPKLAETYFFQCTVNTDPAQGIGYSIACGVRSLKATKCTASAIFLGDMPFLNPKTLELVITNFVQGNCTKITRPSYSGQPGHPVIFPKLWFDELTDLKGDEGAKRIIQKNLDSLRDIPSNDAGVLRDIDAPEDLP